MKASLKTLFLSLLVVIGMGMGTYAQAQEEPAAQPAVQATAAQPAGKVIPEDLFANLNVSFYSQYIWRGYELSRDSLVIFPTMTVGYKGFAVNLWADVDTNFEGDGHDFRLQEADVTLSYSNSYQPWKLNYSLGWILYAYSPGQNQELFTTLGLDTLLKPTLSIYNEIEIGQAWYFSLGISHSFAVYKNWSLDLAGSVSYMIDQSDESFSNMHDGNISAGLKIPLNNHLSIIPKVQVSFPLSGEAAERISHASWGGNRDTFVYGGIILDLSL